MKISIVTPVRNGKRFIRQTVESVLNQQGEFELEYIVCDGQSIVKGSFFIFQICFFCINSSF